MFRKAYLGDAVYVALDSQRGIVLTTEDGVRATNTIVLAPEIWERLQDYMNEVEGT